METTTNQQGINTKLHFLFLAFFLLAGFQSALGQKHTNYKDYVIENFTNGKIAGKVSLSKKFWHTSIYFENKDQGLYEYYYPHQLKGFAKGDSVFIVVRVNYNKFKENAISKRNFALLLNNDSSAVKLYKTVIPMENGTPKEIFIYSKDNNPVVMEDNKNSVLSAVSNSTVLKDDINQYGYEYSEFYFKKLFENYNQWSKDSTVALLNLPGKSILKSDSLSSANSSTPTLVLTTPETSTTTSDSSIALADTIATAPLVNTSETSIENKDSIHTTTVSETPVVTTDTISSSESITIAKDNSTNPEPLTEGFAAGDSILFEYNGLYYPGQLLNFIKKDKYAIKYKGMGEKWKTQNVALSTIYKTTQHPENKAFFGYEIGENANIEVFITKLNTKTLKPCIIIGLNKTRVIINYLTEDGRERVLSVDKNLLK